MATSMLRSISGAGLRRRVNVFSVDPSLSFRIKTRFINKIAIEIPWEADADGNSLLRKGPVGEYLEVVDFDPASDVFYEPVDLDDPRLLATDGLDASESNPQFHQQMVYAVATATIHQFVRALGRPVYWSDRIDKTNGISSKFVRKLRIYPHALRARNAYYSPRKKALLFGYFPVTAKDEDNTPGTTVFTCLSHDIIAHEMTHALLDGIHPRFSEPSNPDVLAFHEAFADLVALFQRFSYEGVLEQEIAETQGNLTNENMMAQLARQFGKATGHGQSLRNALGEQPDANALERVWEPHKRGSYLVAAVFRAFTLVYTERVADLIRISTQGTGVLPAGQIHPDLVNRMAGEARETAAHILRMCIRAVDYSPPVDITFGDYLRAVVTADLDIHPEDNLGYRVAFIESFKEWGIYPEGIRSMSVESLCWPGFAEVFSAEDATSRLENVKSFSVDSVGKKARLDAKDSLNEFLESDPSLDVQTIPSSISDDRYYLSSAKSRSRSFEALDLRQDRFELWKQMRVNSINIWKWLNKDYESDVVTALGLTLDVSIPPTVYRDDNGNPTLEVSSVRPIKLKTDDFGERNFLVVSVLQRRRGYLDPIKQEQMDAPGTMLGPEERGDFIYRAGCTFFIDPETKEIRWVIRTARTINDDRELDRIRSYLRSDSLPHNSAFDDAGELSYSTGKNQRNEEPFALLHDIGED